jgi:phospholipase C
MRRARWSARPGRGRRAPARLALLLLVLLAGSAAAGAQAARAGRAPARAALPACPVPGSIQHVIFLIKENRTFDNYFGKFPGAAGATTAVDSQGHVVPLAAASDTTFGCDIDHSWQGAHNAYDCGKMDKFDQLSFSGTSCDRSQPPPYTNHSLTQFSQADIPSYWAYAQHFTLGDHMFSSLMGPSYPNHLYTVAAQSGGPATGSGAINNPSGPDPNDTGGWGCDVPGQVVQTLPFGPPLCPAPTNYGSHSSCWTFRSLPEEIEAKGTIDWRYYAPGPDTSGYIWSALNALAPIRNDPARWAKVVPYTQLLTDLQGTGANLLQAVSWAVLPGDCSEHPPSSVCQGENYTVQLVNALENGPYWCTSALIVTWDDFGGFYDHLPPPSTSGQDADVFGPGFRAPLLVISPYAKAGFIDPTVYEFSSMLAFAETIFNLPPLTARDASAANMLNAFDFNHVTPRLFRSVRTSCAATCTASPVLLAPDSDLD